MSFFFDWAKLADGTYEPLRPSILHRTDDRAFLYPGRTHWLFGGPKTGKTFLALFAAAEVLRAGGHVVYVDYENVPVQLWGHLTVAFGVSAEVMLKQFHYHRAQGPFVPDGEDKTYSESLDRAMRKYKHAELIVVDGVNKALQLESLEANNNRDVNEWFDIMPNRLQTAAPNAAVICLDHANHAGNLLGSVAKAAGVTGAIYKLTVNQGRMMGKGRRAELNLELFNGNDREGEVATLAETTYRAHSHTWAQMVGRIIIDATAETGELKYEIHPYPAEDDTGEAPRRGRPDETANLIIEILADAPKKSLKRQELIEKLGCTAEKFSRAMAQLTSSKQVHETKIPGRGAPKRYTLLED